MAVITEKMVEAASKAMYEETVKSARKQVEGINFDSSDFAPLFERLKSESETAQVLIVSSFLEDRVTELIKAHLYHLDSQAKVEEVFGTNGPLSTFGSRLSLSYHLGWLSLKQKKKLDAFKKIRNEFAHRAFKVRLADKAMAAHMATINYDLRSFLKPLRSVLTDEGAPLRIIPDGEITKSQENISNLAFLTFYTFIELLILPTANLFHVDPAHIAHPFSELAPIKPINRALIRVILGLVEPEEKTAENK
jgi:DNA-binding MltR family transcriptional regulator